MKPRLYLETTIPSYVVARRSRDPILRGQQAATIEWWGRCRPGYDLFVSEFVEVEAARGDSEMAAARLELLGGLSRLLATDEAMALAEMILDSGLIPPKAAVDASHIAVAAVHGMDFLLTWNCTHIHNLSISRRVEGICLRFGKPCPVICTPFDLLEIEP